MDRPIVVRKDECRWCGKDDTTGLAIRGKDATIVWCSCGEIVVRLGEGMEVTVIRED